MSDRLSITVFSDGSGINLNALDGHNDSCPTRRISLSYDELHYLLFLTERAIDQIDRNERLSRFHRS
jgi:hypothetical protein